MDVKKIFTLLLLVLSFSLLVSAQKTNKEEELIEQQRLEQMRREQEELLENTTKSQNRVRLDDLSYFLPNTENAWFISITTTGGFIGGTRLVAAVNSEGNYLCSAEQNFTNQLIATDVFRPVIQKINGFDFKKFNSHKVKEIEGCKDCAYTTLTFRNGKNSYSYSRNTFANAENSIKEIYDKILDSAACQ